MADRREQRPWLALSALCVGLFMILLDSTIVNIAVPSMLADLHAGLDQILWVVSIYILSYAVPLVAASRLGDRYGRKRLYVIGLFVFTAASACCGLAGNGTQLIIARAVQGAGAALMSPQTLTFITVLFPPNKRGVAFGVWSAVAGVSTIAGPLLGGVIVEDLSWQWIFFVNVPTGLAGILLTLVVVPESRSAVAHRLDPLGILLISSGLFAVMFGLLEGSRYDWGTIAGVVSIPLVIAAGVVLVAAFLVVQYRSSEPLVPLVLFRNRSFAIANVVATAVGFGLVSLLPVVLFLQVVLGFSPLRTGLVTAPASVCAALVAPFAGFRADRTGGKWLLITGLLAFCVGVGGGILVASPDMSTWLILPPVMILGLGTGLLFTTMTTVAVGDMPAELSGAASGVFNTTRQLGQAIGTAAVGALLQVTLRTSVHDRAVAAAAQLPPQVRSGFVDTLAHVSAEGTTQSATAPPGTPPALAAQLQRLGNDVFDHGFVSAMRWTLLLPIGLLLVAAVCCLGLRRRPAPVDEPRTASASAAPAGPGR